jgi:hypothetical protein
VNRRGFTIYELAISIVLMSAVSGAAGAFYLELRTATVRSDASVVLTREASLAAETIGRDLRNANAAISETNGVSVDIGETKPVRYLAEKGVLFRDEGTGRVAIAHFVRELRVFEAKGGFRLELVMERALAEGRSVRIVREAFLGARKR